MRSGVDRASSPLVFGVLPPVRKPPGVSRFSESFRLVDHNDTRTRIMHLRSAAASDLPAIEALLEADDLPTIDVAEHLANFVVGEGSSGILACGGVEYYGDFALLRSIVVARNARGAGLGKAIVDRLLAECRRRAIRSVALLTTTAEHYFADQGFAPVSRDEVPRPLLVSSQFRGVCPASATAMLKVL
jgi:amino-acid N-acetyltransferase